MAERLKYNFILSLLACTCMSFLLESLLLFWKSLSLIRILSLCEHKILPTNTGIVKNSIKVFSVCV